MDMKKLDLKQLIKKLTKVKGSNRVFLIARTDDKDVWNLSSQVSWAKNLTVDSKRMTPKQIKAVLAKEPKRLPEYRLIARTTAQGTDDKDVWNLTDPIKIRLAKKPSS